MANENPEKLTGAEGEQEEKPKAADEREDLNPPAPTTDTTVPKSPSPSPGTQTQFGAGSPPTQDPGLLKRLIVPVLIGILVVAVIALFAQNRSQSGRLNEETAKREEAQSQLEKLEKDLAAKLGELNSVKNDLTRTSGDRDKLKEEVDSLKADQVQIKARLETARSYREELEKRLKAEKNTVSELQQALREDREKQKELFNKIEDLLDEKMSLQEKLVNLKKTGGAVEMPELVVSDDTAGSLNGTVLAVNDQYDFVVFNRGENDGVTPGSSFWVYDNGKKVGEVIARRIFPEMTVADINKDYTHRPLKKRFTVSLNE